MCVCLRQVWLRYNLRHIRHNTASASEHHECYEEVWVCTGEQTETEQSSAHHISLICYLMRREGLNAQGSVHPARKHGRPFFLINKFSTNKATEQTAAICISLDCSQGFDADLTQWWSKSHWHQAAREPLKGADTHDGSQSVPQNDKSTQINPSDRAGGPRNLKCKHRMFTWNRTESTSTCMRWTGCNVMYNTLKVHSH